LLAALFCSTDDDGCHQQNIHKYILQGKLSTEK